jgi:hypothetical protein
MVASFLIGIIGIGIHERLESVLVSLLTGDLSLTGLESSWKVLAGFIVLFYVPVSGVSFLAYIWNSSNPGKRAEIFEGLRRTGVSLVLVSVSFFLYGLVLSFVQVLTDVSLFLASSQGRGFGEEVFFTPFLARDVGVWSLLNGEMASKALFDVYKTGVYTLSLFLLIGTLGIQRVLARFGVLLLPLAVFMYNLPLKVFGDYGLSIGKGLALVLLLPFLDVLLLSVLGALPRGSAAQQVTYILGFLVVGLINWSVIKKVVLNPFQTSSFSARRVLNRFSVSGKDSNGFEGEGGFYKVKNGEVKRLKDLNRG